MSVPQNTLPWVERYRPKVLSELISHDNILTTLKKFLAEDRLPHLLFYGPPGTGKTSTILAIIKQLYEPKEIPSLVLELNASDDRGIDIVRTEIVDFVSARNIFSNKIKLVILDEADSMTKDAQNALRRVIEKYTNHCRFCIIGNYLSKIIPAIQSRCTRFRFAPLTTEQIRPRLEIILKEENAKWDARGMEAVLSLAKGDMRKALNLLQCTYMAYGNITGDNVYSCAGHPLQSEIEAAVTTMMNKPLSEAAEEVDDLRIGKSYAAQDILENIHSFVGDLELPGPVRIYLLDKMADVETCWLTSDLDSAMEDSEKNVEVLNFYGTAVEQLDEDETIGKKPVPIQEQIATDEKGRRRFHGAFTGGFSAGFFNTVGSIEGWTPRTFQSSRESRAEGRSQRPEDYMDTEDFSAHGIAPRKLVTRDAFASQSGVSEKRKYGVSGVDDPFTNMLAPLSESFGVALLKKMGWKPGQGIGPRLRKADKYVRALQQGLTPNGTLRDAQDADSRTAGRLFAPDDISVAKMDAKTNFHGIGYKGIDISKSAAQEHFSLFGPPETSVVITAPTASSKNKKKGIAGQAFGVGAFEDDDEDIYSSEDLSRYDRIIGGEKPVRKEKNMKSIESGHGPRALEGFQRGSLPLHDRKMYPPPPLPKDFKGIHMSVEPSTKAESSRNEPVVDKKFHRHDAKSRNEVLDGTTKQQPVVTSVFDLIPAAHRSRLPGFVKAEDKTVSAAPVTPPAVIQKSVPSVATVDEQRRQNLALFNGSATFESKMTFRPFDKDPKKQLRYELFLRKRQERNKDAIEEVWMDVGSSMTEWERERERTEFMRSASLYRPMSGVMASRFTSAQSGEDESSVVEVPANSSDISIEQKEAVKKKLYGRLTRDTLEWHPHNVLCRRFNVPNPYPGSSLVGLLKVKKDKYSVFNFLNTPDGSSVTKEQKPTDAADDVVANDRDTTTKSEPVVPPTGTTHSTKSKPVSRLIFPEKPQSATKDSEVLQIAEESTERPPMDLFRAIFESSDVEDAADDEEVPSVIPEQPDHLQKLFDMDRFAKNLEKKEFPTTKAIETVVGPVRPPPDVLAAYAALHKAREISGDEESGNKKSKHKKKKKKQRKKHKKERSRTHRGSDSSSGSSDEPVDALKKVQTGAVVNARKDVQSNPAATSPDMDDSDLLKRLKSVLPGRRLTASDFM